MISITVPSYNSLEYLKILVPSIKKNIKFPHEIIVHDNGSSDGTIDWLKQSGIPHTSSETNLGFCGVNNAIKKAKYEYVFILNSDMFVMPACDFAIFNQIKKFKQAGVDNFTISCNLIESSGNNPEFDIFNAGTNASEFNEELLLKWFSEVKPRKEHDRQFSHPILIPKKHLERVGFLDESYFPGWTVDMDLPMSLYRAGCRDFIRLGNARVYHFISKTFNKLPPEIKSQHGQDIFLKKWNLTVDEFRSKIGVNDKPYKSLSGLEL